MGEISADLYQELTIEIPALLRPTFKELREHNRWIKSIVRDTSPEGKVTLILRSVLRSREKLIDATEYERRLVLGPNTLLGFQHYRWILRHQANFPALMVLLCKVYIDFPGIVVRDGNGDRRVPCFLQGSLRWSGDWNCIDAGCNNEALVAFAREG